MNTKLTYCDCSPLSWLNIVCHRKSMTHFDPTSLTQLNREWFLLWTYFTKQINNPPPPPSNQHQCHPSKTQYNIMVKSAVCEESCFSFLMSSSNSRLSSYWTLFSTCARALLRQRNRIFQSGSDEQIYAYTMSKGKLLRFTSFSTTLRCFHGAVRRKLSIFFFFFKFCWTQWANKRGTPSGKFSKKSLLSFNKCWKRMISLNVLIF